MSLFYYKNTLYKNFQDVQDISRMFFKNISYFHIFIYFFILNFWSDTFGINTKNESRMTLSEKLKNTHLEIKKITILIKKKACNEFKCVLTTSTILRTVIRKI